MFFHLLQKALQSNSYLTTLTIVYRGPEYEHTREEDFQVVKNMFKFNSSLTQFSPFRNRRLCLLHFSRTTAQQKINSLESYRNKTCSYREDCSGTHYNASSQQDSHTP